MPKDLNISFLLDCYGTLLTSKQQDVLNLYFNEDLSLGEIAENEGVSRQSVMDLIHRAQNQLYTFEDNLHLADINRRVGIAVDEIQLLNSDDTERIEKIKNLLNF